MIFLKYFFKHKILNTHMDIRYNIWIPINDIGTQYLLRKTKQK